METTGSGSSSEREPLAGLVERVTFHNADSGFCVLRIKARGHRDLVTVLGAAPSIAVATACWLSSCQKTCRGVILTAANRRAGGPNRDHDSLVNISIDSSSG